MIRSRPAIRSLIADPMTLLLLGGLLTLPLSCDSGPPAPPVAGLWEGTLQFPAFSMRVVLRVSASPDSGLSAAVVRPDAGPAELPAAGVTWEGERIRLDIPALHAHLSARLAPGGDALLARWEDPLGAQALELERVGEIRFPRRPQTPHPPFPYREEEVRFESPAAAAVLAGTLTRPETEEPVAAVVLVSGVGGHDRDGTLFGHRPFLVLADHLTRRGLAVLRYDDRGIGASKGERRGATTADFTADALAAVRFVRAHPAIDSTRVGIIGHSEGGTIASLAAAETQEVAFIVMLAAPGLAGREYNLQFERAMGAVRGEGERAAAERAAFQEQILDLLLSVEDDEDARAALKRFLVDLKPPLPPERIAAALDRFLSPWFRFNLRHDPAVTLGALTCPVLAVIGEKDRQVPAAPNLRAIDAALQAGRCASYEVVALPGLNHLFQTAAPGAPSEYGTIEETLAPRLLTLIADWLARHAGGAGGR